MHREDKEEEESPQLKDDTFLALVVLQVSIILEAIEFVYFIFRFCQLGVLELPRSCCICSPKSMPSTRLVRLTRRLF